MRMTIPCHDAAEKESPHQCGGSEVRFIFSASPSSELLNPNRTGIVGLLVSFRIRSSLRSALQIEANFEFGALALRNPPCQRCCARETRLGGGARGHRYML